LRFLEEEAAEMGGLVKALSETARYAEPAREMMKEKGVGLLVAMVFLSEMGDLSRFGNRRRVASYVGLAPSSSESGESSERKGHITHQGSHRVRKVLCQAVWTRVRYDGKEKKAYERIVARNPKHKKIAVVAMMRRLDVTLWRTGTEAQKRARMGEKPAARTGRAACCA
jgi:transposase